MEVILELKTETDGAWDQWGPDVQSMKTAFLILPLASQRCLPEVVQSLCSAENCLHSLRSKGLEMEVSGAIGNGEMVKQEGKDQG